MASHPSRGSGHGLGLQKCEARAVGPRKPCGGFIELGLTGLGLGWPTASRPGHHITTQHPVQHSDLGTPLVNRIEYTKSPRQRHSGIRAFPVSHQTQQVSLMNISGSCPRQVEVLKCCTLAVRDSQKISGQHCCGKWGQIEMYMAVRACVCMSVALTPP